MCIGFLVLVSSVTYSLYTSLEAKADKTELRQLAGYISEKADKADLERVEEQSVFRDNQIMQTVRENQQKLWEQNERIISLLIELKRNGGGNRK